MYCIELSFPIMVSLKLFIFHFNNFPPSTRHTAHILVQSLQTYTLYWNMFGGGLT